MDTFNAIRPHGVLRMITQEKDNKMQDTRSNSTQSNDPRTELLEFLSSKPFTETRPATELQIKTLARLFRHNVEQVRNVVTQERWDTSKASYYIQRELAKYATTKQAQCLVNWCLLEKVPVTIDQVTLVVTWLPRDEATRLIGLGRNQAIHRLCWLLEVDYVD